MTSPDSERERNVGPDRPSSGLICQYQPECVISNRPSPQLLGGLGPFSECSSASLMTTVRKKEMRVSKVVSAS